jgi:hypothetical protein
LLGFGYFPTTDWAFWGARMRFGVRVFCCLFAIITVGSGCRKALIPNIDRNQAPDTYITAAPFDTLTVRDKDGNPVFPDIGDHVIPVRFHMYWAGGDRDGAVVGFYWAVVETSIVSEDGSIPPLPGPKPQDYHFTTRTDSIFIFRVAENVRDRPHAFYIYAVDDHGKADPTPAHFIFIAADNYPPQPDIDYAAGTDTVVYVHPGGALTREVITAVVHDSLPPPLHSYPPTDTVPSRSRLDFHWNSKLRIAGSNVIKYSYKLDEPAFVPVDSSVHAVTYNSGVPDPVTHHLNGPIAPGLKVFTLRAIDQAGGSGEGTRRFIMNYSPDTWWSGPDPTNPAFTLYTDPRMGPNDGKAFHMTNWPGGIPGTYFSPDSTRDRPPQRPMRNTFFEIWKDYIWVRSEYDTVHLNSVVSLWNGGYDKDSPYTMRIDPTDPGLSGLTGDVLVNNGRIGSPIGFRALVVTKLDPLVLNQKSGDTQQGLYPVFEPATVFRKPAIGAYWPMKFSGKAYAVVQAEDADGGRDRTVDITDVTLFADNIDRHLADSTYRRKILEFYVNKAPTFDWNNPSFHPKFIRRVSDTTRYTGCPGGRLAPTIPGSSMDMPAYDTDPCVSCNSASSGGPTSTSIYSLRLTFTAKALDGADTTWTVEPSLPPGSYPTPTSFDITIPLNIASGTWTMVANLCDCTDCRIGGSNIGAGRCVDYNFSFRYTRSTTGCTEPGEASSANTSPPGSDSPNRSH